ncbi:MAG: DivIVA domain-containing protein [Bacillota bacterium]|nr:DivIVA domain-containing protein [Bacillota bacterium]
MIKPVDIQEKTFSKSVRGYREEEVDKFLDEVMIDYEQIIDELRQTKEENSRLVEELERYRKSEGTVLETLETAKTLMSEISASADKRADILLKNAELDAQLITKEAQENADRINEASQALKSRFVDFRTRYKKLLQSELQRFESLSGELFPELGVDDFDDLPDASDEYIAESSSMRQSPKPLRGTFDFSKSGDAEKMQQTVRNIKY